MIVVFAVRSACRSLQQSGSHPLRARQGEVIRRRPDGAVDVILESPDRLEPEPT
jgi:hypothetical protein